ncbi:MAG: hypothetical protein R3E08_06105 [Thiotrichaceae bacterium]
MFFSPSDDAAEVAQAIRDMVACAALCDWNCSELCSCSAAQSAHRQSPQRWQTIIQPTLQQLALARPTAKFNVGIAAYGK